jgi:hypothetical protein
MSSKAALEQLRRNSLYSCPDKAFVSAVPVRAFWCSGSAEGLRPDALACWAKSLALLSSHLAPEGEQTQCPT